MTHPPLRGLVFDLDGTLADNLPVVYQAFRAGLVAGGAGLRTDDEIFALFGPTPQEIFAQVAPGAADTAVMAFFDHYRALAVPTAVAMAGMEDMLLWLAGQPLRRGLVTGGDAILAGITLEHLGLAGYFEAVRVNTTPSVAKLDNLRGMAADWGLDPATVGYVGDAPNDMLHARAAGLLALGAAWGRSSHPEGLAAAGADAVFTHPAQLQAWLAERVAL